VCTMADIIEGVNPTRMELLDMKKKVALANKGHKLLEEKRDALVERFFGIIDQRKKLRAEVEQDFKDAYVALIEAEMILGEDQVESVSLLTGDVGKLSFDTVNIMGVKIPNINVDALDFDPKRLYGFSETCARLDDAHRRFSRLSEKLLRLADVESDVKSLSVEIEKTKRRVNVLEYKLIPNLLATIKYIEMRLEEQEREGFVRSKHIKKMMEKNES